MLQLVSIILTMFTIIGMLFSLICAMFIILVLGFFIVDLQRRRQRVREKQHEREQVTQTLAQIRLEVDTAFKQDVMRQVDLMFQEFKTDGDTDPQVPIVG